MRPVQTLIALFISAIAVWSAFRPIKEYAVFDLFESFPFRALCALTVVFVVMNFRRYSSSKKMISFLPVFLCLTALSAIIWHQKHMDRLDRSSTKFIATTYDIGTDGGLIFDFKENGHLKAEKKDHWILTCYRGKYSMNHDTINLDIPLDFNLSKQALLKADSLHFTGDTTKFYVIRK
jgi:hypothetical protein